MERSCARDGEPAPTMPASRSTRFPVMCAVKTWLGPRKPITSTRPAMVLRSARRQGSPSGDALHAIGWLHSEARNTPLPLTVTPRECLRSKWVLRLIKVLRTTIQLLPKLPDGHLQRLNLRIRRPLFFWRGQAGLRRRAFVIETGLQSLQLLVHLPSGRPHLLARLRIDRRPLLGAAFRFRAHGELLGENRDAGC